MLARTGFGAAFWWSIGFTLGAVLFTLRLQRSPDVSGAAGPGVGHRAR